MKYDLIFHFQDFWTDLNAESLNHIIASITDTHLQTSWSTAASIIGNIRGQEEAYHLARGGTIISSFGLKVRLSRPLDILVVSDHAENLGLAHECIKCLKTHFTQAVVLHSL